VRQHVFDFGDRQAVLLAFAPIPLVPVETGEFGSLHEISIGKCLYKRQRPFEGCERAVG